MAKQQIIIGTTYNLVKNEKLMQQKLSFHSYFLLLICGLFL